VAALDVGDIGEECVPGLLVTVRRWKVDQEGLELVKAIPFGATPKTYPVRALKTWIGAARISSGPLFRSVDRHGNS